LSVSSCCHDCSYATGERLQRLLPHLSEVLPQRPSAPYDEDEMKLYHMLWYILILYYVLWFNMKLCLIKSDIILHYKVWCYIILSDQDIYLFIGWVVTFSLNCNYMDSEINDSRLDRMMMAIPPIGWKAGKSWEWRSTKEKCKESFWWKEYCRRFRRLSSLINLGIYGLWRTSCPEFHAKQGKALSVKWEASSLWP